MTTGTTNKLRLLPAQAPALPFAPVQYEQRYHDQLARILTQYFNQTDNTTNTLVGTAGGHFLSFPHIAASDTTDQTTTDNTATVVKWNTLDSGVGFTLNDGVAVPALANSATATYSGIYKIDYSLQFANTDNNKIHETYVWLQTTAVGGTTFTDYVGSGSKFSVPGEHTTSDGYLVAYSSVTFQLLAGQSVRLMWATSKAYVVSPAADGVYMEAYAAQTVPFAMPSIPSAVGTIAFVSSILA